MPGFIYIKFYHQANNRSKHADGFYNSMIHHKDSHRPSPLIMFTCTELYHALLEWQKNKGVHLKASMSKQKADRPDHSNYFDYKNEAGKNASFCAATGRKLVTSPAIADTYTFLMNTWNTPPESYQQRVYKDTLPTFKYHIQQAANPTPVVVIRADAACVDNAIQLDYLTSEVVVEEPQFRSPGLNIPMDNNCTDNNLHFGMPGCSRAYKDEGDESGDRDTIFTASRRQWALTELERFDLGTSEVDRYTGDNSDNRDVDEQEEALQTDDGSTQNVED